MIKLTFPNYPLFQEIIQKLKTEEIYFQKRYIKIPDYIAPCFRRPYRDSAGEENHCGEYSPRQ